MAYFIAPNGKWNDHLYTSSLAEIGQGFHLLCVQRTEYNVAIANACVLKCGADISVYWHVPRMYVDRIALLFQAVAAH